MVRSFVPGCPDLVIEAHLQDAAIEFCARSGIWRCDIDVDFTSRDVSDYEIDLPSCAALENILTLYLDGHALTPVSDRHFSLPSGRGTGKPGVYSIYQGAQIRFYPTPDKQYRFEGVGVLKPEIDASGLEDFIYQAHVRAICYGAIAFLLIIPGKEWSNPELANYYLAHFHKEADEAWRRDYHRANIRVRPVGFEGTSVRSGGAI